MSNDQPGPSSGEPVINAEVEWGRTYRHQRKQVRKASIAPTASPLNIQLLWEQYQKSKELDEIKELKRKLAAKPSPKILNLPKGRVDPNTISKKKYYDYMATPRQYHEPPPPPNQLEKKPKRESCSPRLIYLALPTKVRVLHTWKDYQHSLPIDFITRLEELLHTDHNLDPKFARCYFKTLDRKKRKQHNKMRKECRKKMREKKRKAKEWLQLQTKTTVDFIIKFLEKEPLFSLNFKQMMLSEAILSKLKEGGQIKNKPPRNTGKPYGRAIVDIVDQLSVWLDTIVRYVDVQYTESVEEIVEVSSIESLGEGEEEEEEGEEEGEGPPKRYSLPPLPPLPDMPPLPEVPGMMPLIKEEGEGVSSYGTISALENAFGEIAAAGAGESEAVLSLGEDTLDMLINILSHSTPERLEELVNPDVLPGITYKDILERLNALRDEVIAEMKKARQSVLEEAMIAWAKSNEPDMVDKKIITKIQDTAGIISECLGKESKGVGVEKEEEKVSATVWESGEETDAIKTEPSSVEPSDIEPSDVEPSDVEPSDVEPSDVEPSDVEPSEAETFEVEPSDIEASEADASETKPSDEIERRELELTIQQGEETVTTETKTLETLQEEGESEAVTPDMIEERDFLEEGEGGELITELLPEEGSAVGPWQVKPTESKTKLLAESKVSAISEKDRDLELDMTGDLRVVMGEMLTPELSENILGLTPSQVMEKQRAEKMRALAVASITTIPEGIAPGMPGVSSIPQVIPGHKPSKVFEHQPDTICCLTLKVWATWLLEVAHNAHAWSRWLNDIINEVRRIAAIIRGEVKDEDGNPVIFYKEDWIEFSEKVDNMITSWRQYSMHVKDLTDKIVHNFRGKTVTCCPKCLEDNLIVDVTLAHSISQQLAEAMNTAGYWRRWLDSVVMETKRLTGATITDNESQASSYGTMEIIELHEPHPAESEESLYEIEELDPNNEN